MNIYVANIAPSVTQDMLEDIFKEYGQVKSTKIINDQLTGLPRGFGFVEMPVAPEAQAAISALNGYELEGKRLTVNKAREREAGARPRFGDRGNFGGNNGHRRDDRSRSRY